MTGGDEACTTRTRIDSIAQNGERERERESGGEEEREREREADTPRLLSPVMSCRTIEHLTLHLPLTCHIISYHIVGRRKGHRARCSTQLPLWLPGE